MSGEGETNVPVEEDYISEPQPGVFIHAKYVDELITEEMEERLRSMESEEPED